MPKAAGPKQRYPKVPGSSPGDEKSTSLVIAQLEAAWDCKKYNHFADVIPAKHLV